MMTTTDGSRTEPRLPHLIVRAGGWSVLVWLVLAGLLAYFARDLEHVLEVGANLRGSESAAVRGAVTAQLEAGDAEYAVLVVRGLDPRSDTLAQRQLDSVVTVVATVKGVARIHAYRGPRDSLLVGEGGTIVLVALDPTAGSGDRTIPLLQAATHPFVQTWRAGGVTLRWTGESALNMDLRRASAGDANAAEARALPLTLIILVLAFGSVIAAGVPVVVGLLTIVCALGAAGLVGRFVPLSLMLQSLVTMIGLGLGIDYALLMVRRFREELTLGRAPRHAAIEAVRHGGHTLVVSGTAVLLGFAGLAIVPLGELRSVGFGGAITALLAVAVSTTLLPPILARMGRVIDRWRVPRLGITRVERWRRWGIRVATRPAPILVAAGLPLVWLAWQGTRLEIGTPKQHWLPPSLESTVGIDDLESIGRAGLLNLVQVLVTLPEDGDVLSPEHWEVLVGVRQHLLEDRRIGTVLSFSRFDSARPMSRLAFATVPRSTRDAYVSEDRRVVLLQAIPNEGIAPQEVVDYVNELRPALAGAFAGRAVIHVGGLPAVRADFQNRLTGWLPIVMLAVITGTFIALAVSFRSILIPLKALVLNLLSVAGGFGMVKLVFQDGVALSLLGRAEPISAVFPIVPILAFCTVFGLSMDYEVFLVSRVAECRRAGLGERAAIAEGLARSAPLITSASAIMVVVFGAFVFGEFLLIQLLGLALAAAVLLDATLVRIAVGPALLAVAGRWNWWPGVRGDRCGQDETIPIPAAV